ncbi:MAG: Uncharacterised protein [Cryomorphaceae bacterium]|nr:MAG: Uncharacterised protein [Cryomorphaceae bacterium]
MTYFNPKLSTFERYAQPLLGWFGMEVNDLENLMFSSPPPSLEGVNAKFARNIRYGDHSRNTFDILLPKTSEPCPLVIFIHGGSFVSGNKEYIYYDDPELLIDNAHYPSIIKDLLAKNIAVATINYPLLYQGNKEGVLSPLMNCHHAVWYISTQAKTLGLDADRFLLAGTSAGGGATLWVAHQIGSKKKRQIESVLPGSTLKGLSLKMPKIKAVAMINSQCSYDLEGRWVPEVFNDYNLTFKMMFAPFRHSIMSFYGLSNVKEYSLERMEYYRNAVDMISVIDEDSPELWIDNTHVSQAIPFNASIASHHPYHARTLVDHYRRYGAKVTAFYGDPVLHVDRNKESLVKFIRRTLAA